MGWFVVGFVYILVFVIVMIWLWNVFEEGWMYLIVLFLLVWVIDMGVYLMGIVFGGCKLIFLLLFLKIWVGLFGGCVIVGVMGVFIVMMIEIVLIFYLMVLGFLGGLMI